MVYLHLTTLVHGLKTYIIVKLNKHKFKRKNISVPENLLFYMIIYYTSYDRCIIIYRVTNYACTLNFKLFKIKTIYDYIL